MNYTVESIGDFTGGRTFIALPGSNISNVIIDHRDIHWQSALFVAFKGSKFDGHAFIPELIDRGVRNFLVTDQGVIDAHKGGANFILCQNVVQAMQAIAKNHRRGFKIPVIGVAGSNGKTIVKEWLNSLLEHQHQICRSPKSYNSQIGAALSVLQLKSKHTLGIFEAGISQPDEMPNLQKVIDPSIGIFTNLGDAHAAHFSSFEEKLKEKMRLFDACETIICCKDQFWFDGYQDGKAERFFTWSAVDRNATVYVQRTKIRSGTTIIELDHQGTVYSIQIPFEDRASIENAIHCFCLTLIINCNTEDVLKRFSSLAPVAMRMEMKRGIENSVLIDDSYNSDLGSLQAALDQLAVQKADGQLVILTDMYQNLASDHLYKEISEQLNASKIDHLVLIGPEIGKFQGLFKQNRIDHFEDVEAYLSVINPVDFRNKAVLVKGARAFRLEKLVHRLQAQQHETVLEVDLHKLGKNLEYFRGKIKNETLIMVMVKAFSYGSGGYEIANFLQTQNIDYLSVAYADEGVALRKRGIRLPIMVMSPVKSAYDSIIRFQLEPEIYSIRSLKEFIETAGSLRHLFHELNIHLKVDSGMHRLGFSQGDMEELGQLLTSAPFIHVRSVFTHLSAADNEVSDAFTEEQIETYLAFADEVEKRVGHEILRHALNSTGVLRFPQFHFDMVRIGIGLYGFAGSEHSKYLQALGLFKSYIIQIRTVDAMESVGYNRAGKGSDARRIATVAVGYADGLDRRLGNGKWALSWQGKPCSIVGDVCMDMCMIDVTDCAAQEGDEVVIFAGSTDVHRMAKQLDTIPYEILTKVSQRVNRIYLQE